MWWTRLLSSLCTRLEDKVQCWYGISCRFIQIVQNTSQSASGWELLGQFASVFSYCQIESFWLMCPVFTVNTSLFLQRYGSLAGLVREEDAILPVHRSWPFVWGHASGSPGAVHHDKVRVCYFVCLHVCRYPGHCPLWKCTPNWWEFILPYIAML